MSIARWKSSKQKNNKRNHAVTTCFPGKSNLRSFWNASSTSTEVIITQKIALLASVFIHSVAASCSIFWTSRTSPSILAATSSALLSARKAILLDNHQWPLLSGSSSLLHLSPLITISSTLSCEQSIKCYKQHRVTKTQSEIQNPHAKGINLILYKPRVLFCFPMSLQRINNMWHCTLLQPAWSSVLENLILPFRLFLNSIWQHKNSLENLILPFRLFLNLSDNIRIVLA